MFLACVIALSIFLIFCLVGCGMGVFLTKYLNRKKMDISAVDNNSGELKLMHVMTGTRAFRPPFNTSTSFLRPLYSELNKSLDSQFVFKAEFLLIWQYDIVNSFTIAFHYSCVVNIIAFLRIIIVIFFSLSHLLFPRSLSVMFLRACPIHPN